MAGYRGGMTHFATLLSPSLNLYLTAGVTNFAHSFLQKTTERKMLRHGSAFIPFQKFHNTLPEQGQS